MLRLAWPLTLVVAFFWALGGASALAAPNIHVFSRSFGAAASSPANPNPLSVPTAVAVDEATHDVYVTDPANRRVEKFTEGGEFILTFGKEVNKTKVESGTATAAEEDVCAAASVDVCQAGTAGSTPGAFVGTIEFESAAPRPGLFLAVDNSTGPSKGDVYVGDPGDNLVQKFDSTGSLVTTWGDSSLNGPAPQGQLDGSSAPEGPFAGPLKGVATDAAGHLFVCDENDNWFEFAQDGAFGSSVNVPRATKPAGIGIDAFGNRYKVNGFEHLNEFSPTGEELREFALSATTGFALDRATGDAYIGTEGSSITRVGPSPAETFGAGHLSGAEGLAVDSSTNTVYAANAGTGAVAAFAPPQPAAPVLTAGSTSAISVSSTSADLDAEVNPNLRATTFHFEYGPDTTYGQRTTESSSIGADFGEHSANVQVQGLQPDTTYHFRIVATNELGSTSGEDATFTTQGAAATLLPDARAWELVSPPDKHGAPLEGLTAEGGVIQAAADGSALAYISNGPVDTEPEGNRSVTFSQLLARHQGQGAWSTRDLSTPHQTPAGVVPGVQSEYRLFSTDLSSAAVEPFGSTPLSSGASDKTPYLRSDFVGTGFCTGTCYRPLVTGCPELGPCPPAVESEANVPAGTKFGALQSEVVFVTATPDLSHALLQSSVGLVPGFETGGGAAIYEWSAGSLAAVSVLPDGAPATPANAGNQSSQVREAISTDGSRVVFETNNPSNLYLRANATARQSASGACDEPGRACTIQLDAAEPSCAGCVSGGGEFQIASADDSRVFFTDQGQLTSDSTARPGSPDLYMCQIEEPQPGHLACALTDLTANTVDPGEPAAVQGDVIGAASDGSSLYFVAQGALTAGAVRGDCGAKNKFLASQSCNLYRYDAATATTKLVAVLSGADFPAWEAGFNGRDLSELTSRVSPNGRYLAFMSQRSLTGYDNRDAKTDARDQEVYLYDSAAGPGSGLACASCNPTGARPHGVFDAGVFPGLLVDRAGTRSQWADQILAANIPGWTKSKVGSALYQSRYLSDSGRLFFNAADALVPADTNGSFDVYEFEYPQGPGQPESNNCTTSTSTYSPRSGGCVSLISSGTSPEESAFLDASETGNDVFFLTASRLTAKDEDKALDVYDARVGGGEPEVVRPVECSGDACQRPAVAPNDATPGSLTFNGAGNVVQCPKGKVAQKGKCVKKKSPPKKKHKKNGKHPKKKNGKGKKSKRNAGKKPGGGK